MLASREVDLFDDNDECAYNWSPIDLTLVKFDGKDHTISFKRENHVIVVDMVNDNRGEMAFAARGHAPLSDVVLSLSMSTTIVNSK